MLLLCVLCIGASFAPSSAETAEIDSSLAGRPAPPFVLPKLCTDALVDSDTLYDANAVTLLAFWTTHCAECTRRLESCNDLAKWGGPEGLGFVAVNWDSELSSKARLLAEAAAPLLLHAHDGDGWVSGSIGANSHNFSLYLVDPSGLLQVAYHDLTPAQITNLREELTPWLRGEEEGAPRAADPPPTHATGARFLIDELGKRAQSKIQLSGLGRLRWMDIDTTGTGAVGANGEPLEPGASLRHRVELTLSYQITPSLRAGGLIRISNEGEQVLRSGPDYLSHEGGSFFLRHDVRGRLPLLGRVQSRLTGGYYRLSLTPLTLMRWDQTDTPISGGQRAQGCGVCGGDAGMAGFIRSESLEKLGPDLALEGARWALTLRDRVDLLALYARTQTPSPADEQDCWDLALAQNNHYLQQLYGLRAGTQFRLPWGPEPLELAATGLLVDEDADQPSWDAVCMGKPFQDRILAADLILPVAGVVFETEVAASHWNSDKDDKTCGQDCHRDGAAVRVMLTHELRAGETSRFLGLPADQLRAKLTYAFLQVDGDFYSPYSALSYESNLRGMRGSARVDWGPVGVGVFYKQQETIEEVMGPSYASPQDGKKTTSSVWMDAQVWRGGILMVGGVQDDRKLFTPGQPSGHLGPAESKIFILSFTQELGPRTSIMAEVEWLDGEWLEGITGSGPGVEQWRAYESRVARVMMDVEF